MRSRYCSIERSRHGRGGEQCPSDIIGVFNFDQTDVLCLLKFVTVEVYFHSLRSSGLVVSRGSFPSATSSQIQMSRGDVAMDSPIVLCIDDRPQALEFRKATLESRGYCVKTASSGSTAMKMLDEDVRGDVRLRGSTRVQTRRHGHGGRSLPYQATVSQPADHPAISVLRDASANSVVGG